MNNDSDSRGASRRPRADTDGDDSMLKRKASDDSMDDEGPSQKNQHTGSLTVVSWTSSNGTSHCLDAVGPDRRSSTSSRRKSANGNPVCSIEFHR